MLLNLLEAVPKSYEASTDGRTVFPNTVKEVVVKLPPTPTLPVVVKEEALSADKVESPETFSPDKLPKPVIDQPTPMFPEVVRDVPLAVVKLSP